MEDLEILVENLLVALSGKVRAGFKDAIGQVLNLHARDGSEGMPRFHVKFRAGWRPEHEGIGNDGGKHKACNLPRDLYIILEEHAIDDGGRAPEGLVAKVDRLDGFQRADPVVVDDLEDVGFVNALHGLTLLIVVHENQLLPLHIEEVPAGKHAHVVAVPVEDREVPVADFRHPLPHVVHRIVEFEGLEALLRHEILDRHGLVDEAGHREGVILRGNEDAVDGGCLFHYIRRHRLHPGHNHAGRLLFEGNLLPLFDIP